MEVVSDSVDKVGIELAGCRISALEFLNVIVSSISEEGFLLILGEQAGNLTGGKDHVDVLQELFFLDLGISEDEAAVLAEATSDLEVFLDVFLQVLLRVVLYQLNLLILHALDEC